MCCGAALRAGIDASVHPPPAFLTINTPPFPPSYHPPASHLLPLPVNSTFAPFPRFAKHPQSTPGPLAVPPPTRQPRKQGWEANCPEDTSNRGSTKPPKPPSRSLLLRRRQVMQGLRKHILRVGCGGCRVQRVHKVGGCGTCRMRRVQRVWKMRRVRKMRRLGWATSSRPADGVQMVQVCRCTGGQRWNRVRVEGACG